MTDFKNALYHLFPETVRTTFNSLDKEQSEAMSKQPNDIRVEPSENEVGVEWSMSQWQNLRLSQLISNQDGQDFAEADAVPTEIREVQSMFPSFYQSMNE